MKGIGEVVVFIGDPWADGSYNRGIKIILSALPKEAV